MAHESATSRAGADGFVARVAALDGLALDPATWPYDLGSVL
jgi:hypothetical protein